MTEIEKDLYDRLNGAVTEASTATAGSVAMCSVRDLRNALAYWKKARETGTDAVRENEHMRATLAMHKAIPCPYCKLPASEWATCAAGFPGCARADDANMCGHVGAALAAEELLRSICDEPVGSFRYRVVRRINEFFGK